MRKAGFISLFFHLALVMLLAWPAHESLPPPPSGKLAVRTLSQKDYVKELKQALEAHEDQIVHSEERLTATTAPAEAKFLSKTHQSIDQETRAAHVGKFKNVAREGGEHDKDSPLAVAKLFELTPLPTPTRAPASLPAPTTGRLRAGDGFSATDDYLSDIAIGAETLLNAREFKYYSFYERVRERLTERWQVRLRDEFHRLDLAQSTLNGELTTKVRVQLTPHGEIKRLTFLGKSGVDELDRAARDAFYQAAPFPNPPQGMMDEGSLVSIRWDFVVLANQDGSPQIRMQRGGL